MNLTPVKLEDIPQCLRLEEIPVRVLVPNPGGIEIQVRLYNYVTHSLYHTFTSEDLPDVISYSFLGLVHYPNGYVYPRYKSNSVTKAKFYSDGSNLTEYLNEVAKALTFQEKMLDADSINKSDLTTFDFSRSSISYFVAGMYSDKFIKAGYGLCTKSGDIELPVCPAMTLDCKIINPAI